MKNFLKIFVLATVLIVSFTNQSFAEKWEGLAKTARETVIFDTDSLKKEGVGRYSFTELRVLSTYEGNRISEAAGLKKRIQYIRTKRYFNFLNNTMAASDVFALDSDKNVIYSNELYVESGKIVPGSIGEKIFKGSYETYKEKFGK